MDDQQGQEELRLEIEKGRFVRAALAAESLALSEAEIQALRHKALYQMSAGYRNAAGTRILAERYGLSRKEVGELLENMAGRESEEGKGKVLEPCYDHPTGKYLSFDEWLNQLMKNWDRLSTS